MNLHTMFVIFFVVVNTLGHNVFGSEQLTIETKIGSFRGNVKTIQQQPQPHNYLNDSPSKIYEFLGIRYGVPPVGNLRFSPSTINQYNPQNPNKKTTKNSLNNNIYDATNYGPACYQLNAASQGIYNMSEDCLFLNIWTPYDTDNSNNTSNNDLQSLPVMIFIHGGSFVSGAGSLSIYASDGLTSRGKNIVAVTINYRLGPLGFFASDELYEENMQLNNIGSYGGLNGINDQIVAIEWVHKYIENFGGNPNDITIFGESAGGLSVCYLLFTPLLANATYVNKAIIESGPCNGPWGPLTTAVGVEYANERCENANISSGLAALRAMDPLDLTQKLETSAEDWFLSVDKWVIADLPRDLLTPSTVLNVNKLIMGFNSLDGLLSWPYRDGTAPTTPSQFYSTLGTYISNATQVNLLYNYYYPMSDFINASVAYYTVNADVCVICPSLIFMETAVSGNSNDINSKNSGNSNDLDGFVYYFRTPASPYLAPHASELPFVFDKEFDVSYWSEQWSTNLSYSMISAWTNMAKYGLPNITNQWTNVYFDWTLFNSDESVIIFDNNVRIESQFTENYRNNVCHFWWNQVGFDDMLNLCFDDGE